MDHFNSEHLAGYVAFGLSMPLPADASQEFREGYKAHRWEQIAYVISRPERFFGSNRRLPQ